MFENVSESIVKPVENMSGILGGHHYEESSNRWVLANTNIWLVEFENQ